MYTGQDLQELTDGLGFQLQVDGSRSLTDLTAAVDAVCGTAEARPGPAVIVVQLTSSPASGRSWPRDADVQQVNRWERAVRRLERLSAVSIAVADETCGGPALDLLLATDYRIATAGMRLALPVNDGQFWPGMAVHRLVHQVGVARARQLVLWGDEITAERAVAIGLVDEVATRPADAVRAAVVMLGRIAGKDLAVRRQLLLEAATTTFEEALGTHLAACDRELRRIGRSSPAGAQADQADG